ncbi:hypothetical protein CEXT_418001 [Caerostris extrusa]|uniref:Uncharacterized protein n=1 Tax=Caerostris extrusa TaxID=172846 RepID=A0AAV4VDG7_CAEEX|nr:hypothetical protein CEXT_418001 [Caerostris extrusa]
MQKYHVYNYDELMKRCPHIMIKYLHKPSLESIISNCKLFLLKPNNVLSILERGLGQWPTMPFFKLWAFLEHQGVEPVPETEPGGSSLTQTIVDGVQSLATNRKKSQLAASTEHTEPEGNSELCGDSQHLHTGSEPSSPEREFYSGPSQPSPTRSSTTDEVAAAESEDEYSANSPGPSSNNSSHS